MRTKRYGVIDIGTLKIKCQIVEKNSAGELITLYQSNNLTCLGCEMEQNSNQPQEKNLQKTLDELKRCKKEFKKHEVLKSRIVSTHALREMGTIGQDIVNLIKKQVELEVEIISQQEEAELFFQAVLKDFETDDQYVVIDVGGGSVQILIGSKNGLKNSFMLKTGTVSLWDKFTPQHTETDFPNCEEIKKMKDYITTQLQPIPKRIKSPIIYGSSCIIDLFQGISLPMQKYSFSKSHPYKTKVADMAKFLEQVWSIPYDTREKKYISPTHRYMWGLDKAFLNVVELANRINAPFIIPSNANINQGLLMSIMS